MARATKAEARCLRGADRVVGRIKDQARCRRLPGGSDRRCNRSRQSALAAEANAALLVAQSARTKAEDQLSTAMKERAAQENSVRGMLDDLKSLVGEDEVLKKQLKDVADDLGLPHLEASFDDLEARVGEVRSVSG